MKFASSPYAKTESQRYDPMSTRGMVTSPHYLATQAGVDILRKGGTALDAAVAVAAVLAVVYPQMCSIGGDNFWLAHEAATGALHGINACGRSGENASRDFFAQKGLSSIPLRGAAGRLYGSRRGFRLGRSPYAQPLMGQPACLG
ncbi:MAG: gamma-glutamyltransferase [Desulfovibrio sp.]